MYNVLHNMICSFNQQLTSLSIFSPIHMVLTNKLLNNNTIISTNTGVFDSDSINTLSYLPKSVAITGSGIIAIEFAKIFKNLGSDVTLIIRDNIPRNALMKIGLDKDIAATLVADLVRIQLCVESII